MSTSPARGSGAPTLIVLGVLAVTVGCKDKPRLTEGALVAAPAHPAGAAANANPAPAPGFIGVIVAGDAADLEPKVEARVEALLVNAGDLVKKGAPIARVDVRDARHELASAGAGLREASRRLERRRRVGRGNSGAVTEEEIDAVEREVAQERARVARLAQAVEEATLTAPFDGTVTETYRSAGALAGPGRPIARLVGVGEPRVRFAIPEDRAGTVPIGRIVDVEIASLGVQRRARVAGLSPEIDTSSRMVYASATFHQPNQPPKLTTGLIARVHVTNEMLVTSEAAPPDAAPVAPAAAAPPVNATPPVEKQGKRGKRAERVDRW